MGTPAINEFDPKAFLAKVGAGKTILKIKKSQHVFKQVTLLGRAAWAHDDWSAPNITARFQALPGSIFVVTGATPATDLALASAGVEIGFRNGFSLGARFDGEFAENSQKYSGLGWLRYTW